MEDQGSGEVADTIGGLTPDTRNLISGNGAGVLWTNGGGTGHLVEGNDMGEWAGIKRLCGLPYVAISPRYSQRSASIGSIRDA